MTKPHCSAPRRRTLKKRPFTRRSVLKMLAVMSQPHDENEPDAVKDFLTTGRVGRRNALPDIMSDHAQTTTADLPEKLDRLTTEDTKDQLPKKEVVDTEPAPSTSSS